MGCALPVVIIFGPFEGWLECHDLQLWDKKLTNCAFHLGNGSPLLFPMVGCKLYNQPMPTYVFSILCCGWSFLLPFVGHGSISCRCFPKSTQNWQNMWWCDDVVTMWWCFSDGFSWYELQKISKHLSNNCRSVQSVDSRWNMNKSHKSWLINVESTLEYLHGNVKCRFTIHYVNELHIYVTLYITL